VAASANIGRSIESLARGIQRCRACRLHRNRTHAVPGEGPSRAAVVLVGEAPGRREDETGRPFQGPAGVCLDELLAETGLRREDLFITSSVKCRPPGNRDPRPDELATCRGRWLDAQLARIDPAVVVTLGAVPARALLGETRPLQAIHGRPRERDGRIWLVAYHPAAAMRFPRARRGLRRDLKVLRGLKDNRGR